MFPSNFYTNFCRGKGSFSRNDTEVNVNESARHWNATGIDYSFSNDPILSLESTSVDSQGNLSSETNKTSHYMNVIEDFASRVKEDIVNKARGSGLTNEKVIKGLKIAGLSLAIGIAVGAIICLLGPLITYLCLSRLGYQRPGIPAERYLKICWS